MKDMNRSWDVRTWLALIAMVSVMSGVLGYWMASGTGPDARTRSQAGNAFPAEQTQPASAPAFAAPGAPLPPAVRSRNEAGGAPASGPSQEEVIVELERRFRADKPDPQWAAVAEKALMDAAVEPALTAFSTPKDFKADCMGRMCKVFMHFETLMQAQDWAELYVVGTSEAMSLARISVQPSKNGGADLIIFGARKGSESLMHMPARAHPEIADVVRR